MSKKVDNKKEINEAAEKPKKPINENFNKYSVKQHELINYMKDNGFNITVFGAPQSYLKEVSNKDPDPKHTTAYDKLSFVEDYFKNHLEEAKKEYVEHEKIVEENKKNKPKTHKEHRCNCQFCTHKTLKKEHTCNCKYCPIHKDDDKKETEETAEEVEPNKKEKASAKGAGKAKETKPKATTKPKETKPKASTKPKAPAKGKGKAKTEEQVEEVDDAEN